MACVSHYQRGGASEFSGEMIGWVLRGFRGSQVLKKLRDGAMELIL